MPKVLIDLSPGPSSHDPIFSETPSREQTQPTQSHAATTVFDIICHWIRPFPFTKVDLDSVRSLYTATKIVQRANTDWAGVHKASAEGEFLYILYS